MLRWSIRIGAGLVFAVGAFVAWHAPAPYALPERRFVAPTRDFEPTVQRRAGPPRRVVVLIFDGLSPAAVRAASTPHLDRMAREGASTTDMRPSFPTVSLPNHFTLSTGCHPGHHGVVSNHFIDPERGVYNAKGDADWVQSCELLHEVAERQGVRSAVLAAVGNSSSSRGRLATVAEPFEVPPKPAAHQTAHVIELLESRPEIELIVAYSTEPDESGHTYGPVAAATLAVTEVVDGEVGRVLEAIERLGLRDEVTLVVTTDHGMVDAGPMLNAEGILRRAGVNGMLVGSGVMGHVHLDEPGERAAAMRALAGGDHYEVLDPADAPAGLALRASARQGDLLIVPDEGYWLADAAHVPWYLRWASSAYGDLTDVRRFAGIHGYDADRVPGVRAVFFAWGRGVPEGLALEGLRSVDVHPTVAGLLGIEPGAPLDGRAHPALVRGEPAGD